MSRRKVITPQAVPRACEVISLADYRAPKPTESNSARRCPKPREAQEGDRFFVVDAMGGWQARSYGARRNDLIMVLVTDEVREGDFAAIADQEGGDVALGRIHFESNIWVGLTDADNEYEEEWYQRQLCKIEGRVVSIVRHGKYITPRRHIRPIREAARIIPFKRAR